MAKKKLKLLPPPRRTRTPVVERLRAEIAWPGLDDIRGFAFVAILGDRCTYSFYGYDESSSSAEIIGGLEIVKARALNHIGSRPLDDGKPSG